jgi:hypothetical protein
MAIQINIKGTLLVDVDDPQVALERLLHALDDAEFVGDYTTKVSSPQIKQHWLLG